MNTNPDFETIARKLLKAPLSMDTVLYESQILRIKKGINITLYTELLYYEFHKLDNDLAKITLKTKQNIYFFIEKNDKDFFKNNSEYLVNSKKIILLNDDIVSFNIDDYEIFNFNIINKDELIIDIECSTEMASEIFNKILLKKEIKISTRLIKEGKTRQKLKIENNSFFRELAYNFIINNQQYIRKHISNEPSNLQEYDKKMNQIIQFSLDFSDETYDFVKKMITCDVYYLLNNVATIDSSIGFVEIMCSYYKHSHFDAYYDNISDIDDRLKELFNFYKNNYEYNESFFYSNNDAKSYYKKFLKWI